MIPGSGWRLRGAAVRRVALAAAVAATWAAPAQPHPHGDAGGGFRDGFSAAVRAALPSVVSIYAHRIQDGRLRLFDNSFFNQFFGDFFPEARRRRVENSLGSGVIVGEGGIVVTAEHVIRGAEQISVVLADRRERSAEVLLADADVDLAVLRLSGAADEAFPVLAFRDADEMAIGDVVLAIGNPLGVGQTVTVGILSALARSGAGGSYLLQTDAAINVGNSGGALVDSEGRLVGVNTALVTRSGGSDGIGFAVPSNLVARALAVSAEGKSEIPKPWFGVNGQEVTQEILEVVGLERPEGFLVSEVDRRSGFRSAGVEAGDVIVSVDGNPVHMPSDLIYRMVLRGPGAETEIGYLRQGERLQGRVQLDLPPLEPPPERRRLGADAGVFAGAVVAHASPRLAVDLGVPSVGIEGVMVSAARGRAASWLRPGDLVRSVNDREVRTVDDLVDLLNRRSGGRLRVEIERNGRRLTAAFGR